MMRGAANKEERGGEERSDGRRKSKVAREGEEGNER